MENNQVTMERTPTMLANRKTSLSKLIIWNVSKALEKNHCLLDLKSDFPVASDAFFFDKEDDENIIPKKAIKSTQERVDSNMTDITTLISDYPEERHITCALLAWQQLGHRNADSLYEFIRSKGIEPEDTSKPSTLNNDGSKSLKGTILSNHTNKLFGPVVKLPLHTSIVMRLENSSGLRKEPNKFDKARDIMVKIDEACCQEAGCVERLAAVEAATQELRKRAARLAKREADRIELFERAEAAWKDLEMGYKRRLRLAKEKEDSIADQVPKSINERNSYKSACAVLVKQLRQKTQKAESERNTLITIEQKICQIGCNIVQLRDDAIKVDAELTKYHCGATQQDSDALHKEDNLKRKLSVVEHELENVNELINETERSFQLELKSVKDQISTVSKQLISQDEEAARITSEITPIQNFISNMVSDINTCKKKCDENMKNKMEELKEKRSMLKVAKNKFKECRCKLPIDETVEVKRTPSVAAVCYCEPADRFNESCSCTTLRKKLLSDLLSDLFSGLQAELGYAGAEMPCQLLKCLEDSHNWDRASDAKNNLRNYFAKLLTGEIDIAIATSIEKYHAKWIGNTCADVVRMNPSKEFEEWQEKALERTAHALAEQLAEQLLKDKVNELTKKETGSADPPGASASHSENVYQCLVSTPTTKKRGRTASPSFKNNYHWQRACEDVTQLRVQIEDLKKETIKREDLKLMEQKIAKSVKVAMGGETSKISRIIKKNHLKDTVIKTDKANNTVPGRCLVNQNKNGCLKKKPYGNVATRTVKNPYTVPIEREKPIRFVKQSYAVNVCLCSDIKDTEKIKNLPMKLRSEAAIEGASSLWKNELVTQVLNVKQSKPIELTNPIEETQEKLNSNATLDKNKNNGNKRDHKCVACFQKNPSNTSIDQLLQTLVKWKCELLKSVEQQKEQIQAADQIPYDSPSKKNDKIPQIEFNLNPQSVTATTESEKYMGAVNLEKSNDILLNNKVNQKHDTVDKNDKSIFKSINFSNPCNCIKQSECNTEKISIEPNIEKSLGDTVRNFPTERINTKEKSNDVAGGIQNTDVCCKNCDNCDYKLKFLGVTLTDTAKNPRQETQNNEIQTVLHETFCTNNVDNQHEKQHIKENKRNHDQKKNNINSYNISLVSNELTEAQNSQQHSQKDMANPKHMLNMETKKEIPYSKHRGDFLQTKDENVNIQSFRNVKIKKSQSCICCDKTITDEAENLETNTFKLLEEHLRIKLDEFKSSCISSCVTPETEEKMFNNIIDKVKRIISNSTDKILCKCTKEENSEGSWARAYCLLQEYLKTKLSRVKCSCVSNKVEDQSILPDVLTKVCHSIENDFKRLEDFCKCKTLVKSTSKKSVTPSNDTPTLKNQVKHTDQDELKSNESKCPMEAMKSNYVVGNAILKDNKYIFMDNNINNQYQGDYVKPTLPYIGYTVECSCTSNISPCNCSKSLAQSNTHKANVIWNNAIYSKPDQRIISYIMSKSHKKAENQMYAVNLVEAAAEIAPIMRNISTQWINMMCDMLINTSNDEVFKESVENNNINQALRKTGAFDDNLSTGTNYENPEDWYESEQLSQTERTSTFSHLGASETAKILDVNENQFDVSNYIKLNDFIDHINESHVKNITNDVPAFNSQDCDCNMVPICHVKMLMENIEKKLFHSKCTCDSLSSKVCPVHAKAVV